METIINLFQSSASYIVPFIILLGALIFIHELGHFAVAKFYGVRVEVFSIGFGKKILQKKVGDTVYCVSIIPFGGYVKMFGDDPTAEIPPEELKYSFKDKPVWPRIAIVLAGPVMNAILAGILFVALAGIGERTLSPQLGEIEKGTAAYTAGFRSGDVIKSIDGKSVYKWDQVKKSVEQNMDKPLAFSVDRKGAEISVTSTPTETDGRSLFGEPKKVGGIKGFSNFSKGSAVGIDSTESVAYKAGLRTGDIVRKVDGQEITKWSELLSQLESHKGQTVQLAIQRDNPDKLKDFELKVDNNLSGIASSDLFLTKIMDDSAAAKAGLEEGDRITSINGNKITSSQDIIKNVRKFKAGDKPLEVAYVRNGQTFTKAITPTKMNPEGGENQNFALGIVMGLVFAPPPTFIYKVSGLTAILSTGWKNTVHWTKMTALSYLKLFQGKVSAKNLGGPLMIGKLASDTWKIGISSFLRLMAIISINLFLLNLLPIPVLDGGHLVIFSVEAIKGSPLSLKKIEVMQQVGMVLLLGLMVFAMFNDIVRFFWS